MTEYKSIKNTKGQYEKVAVEIPPEPPSIPPVSNDDLCIDTLLKSSLGAIDRLLKLIWTDVSHGSIDRATVQNLKDVVSMLLELKKKEQDMLDMLPDADLKKLAEDVD